MRANWEFVQTEENEAHVIPVDDTGLHAVHEKCACEPQVVFVYGFISYAHKSYDGREHSELDHVREVCERCKDLKSV